MAAPASSDADLGQADQVGDVASRATTQVDAGSSAIDRPRPTTLTSRIATTIGSMPTRTAATVWAVAAPTASQARAMLMTTAGRMKPAPAARKPGQPARRRPMASASSLEFGPGMTLVAATRSMKSSVVDPGQAPDERLAEEAGVGGRPAESGQPEAQEDDEDLSPVGGQEPRARLSRPSAARSVVPPLVRLLDDAQVDERLGRAHALDPAEPLGQERQERLAVLADRLDQEIVGAGRGDDVDDLRAAWRSPRPRPSAARRRSARRSWPSGGSPA